MGPGSPPEGVSRSRPVAVAITGGIGAGKTEALHAFARHGAATISSDDIVHQLLREDEATSIALRSRGLSSTTATRSPGWRPFCIHAS